MSVALPIILFLLGLAIGGGLIWFLLRQRISDAREQERHRMLSDVRVADERAAAKDVTIDQLRTEIAAKNHLLDQRVEENVQLKEQNAILQTRLKNEEHKTEEKLELLDDAEQKFVAKLSEPVMETLEKLHTKIGGVDRVATGVGSQLSILNKALQKPEVRGRWGEMGLERVFEMCGLVEGRDYYRQRTIGDDDTQLRPDYIVSIPGGMHLAIDAKAPISAYLEAAEAHDDESMHQERLRAFVAHVRERVKDLNSKSYHQNLEDSPEFVVLYLPMEAVFAAALRLDVGLLEYAANQRVILAGPTVVMSIVLGVAHGWKQESLTKHAKEIAELGKELHKRISDFASHLNNVGRHLKKSTEAYNAAVGSLESRVMPQARRLEELKVAPGDKRIGELVQIETVPRNLHSDEFPLLECDEADGELAEQEALPRPR